MKIHSIMIIVLLLIGFNGYSQSYSTNNKKAIKLFEQARTTSSGGMYTESLRMLKEAVKLDSTFFEAYLLSSDIYQEIDSIPLQIKALETAIRIKKINYPKVYYTLGNAYYGSGIYDKAIVSYNRYLQEAGEGGTFVAKAKQYANKSIKAIELVSHPVPFNIRNLGPNINSADDEYWPSLTVDGQMMVFTRLVGSSRLAGHPRQMIQEDFYASRLVNGQWQPSEPLSSVNTENNEGAQSISADGKLLFFTICGREDGHGSCDIYFSGNRKGVWSKALNAGSPVNSGAWETQPSISANGKTLFFVSNRSGGKGGTDLWQSDLLGFSDRGIPIWSKPVNLGDSINTPGNENSPFIHSDGQTLYFASDYWDGLGGYDIFYSRKVNNSYWTKPRNIGYPINSFRDEQGLIVDAMGRNAYYSSDRPGSQRKDIYTFELYEEARPVPVTYIKGKVMDADTGEPLCANVELIDLQDSTSFIKVESCWEIGEFLICLPLGKEYAFNVDKEGYLFYSENYQMKEIKDYINPFILEIKLKKIEAGSSVVLRNVFFKTDSYELLPESMVELNKLTDFLKSNPTIHIELEGHTDNVGSEDYNLNLSQARAREVFNYLLDNGIKHERMIYKGYGYSRPISTNDTPEGRALNRRTEFKIIRK
ncbi:MAG: OmpA family protein [Candidatus Saccharibacteria bacterium]